jgi:transcriptional regulator of arginine metabolism
MPIAPEIRTRRRQAILEILEQQPVAKQSDFVQLLLAKGLEATQSSVSRDLRELGIAKHGEGYAQVSVNEQLADAKVPEGFIREVRTAGANLTVVQTATGAASRVALSLDRSNWPEIVGTISGDDTIFVATKNANDQKHLLSKLRSLQH